MAVFLVHGKGQSETFDALIAWTAIVVFHYVLLVFILSKRYFAGPIYWSIVPIFGKRTTLDGHYSGTLGTG